MNWKAAQVRLIHSKDLREPSQDNGLLKELLSSMDIPESILKTKITSLLISDKGNDLTISDILKKIMELSKTNDETSSETDKSTPGEANCRKSTNHSKRKQNDNTELRKLLFANRSVARETPEHPDRALYSYPSVTPSQILTGPPLMRGRGRPSRRRSLRPDPQQHQAMRSRENGDTSLEPNPSMMPMPHGARVIWYGFTGRKWNCTKLSSSTAKIKLPRQRRVETMRCILQHHRHINRTRMSFVQMALCL